MGVKHHGNALVPWGDEWQPIRTKSPESSQRDTRTLVWHRGQSPTVPFVSSRFGRNNRLVLSETLDDSLTLMSLPMTALPLCRRIVQDFFPRETERTLWGNIRFLKDKTISVVIEAPFKFTWLSAVSIVTCYVPLSFGPLRTVQQFLKAHAVCGHGGHMTHMDSESAPQKPTNCTIPIWYYVLAFVFTIVNQTMINAPFSRAK